MIKRPADQSLTFLLSMVLVLFQLPMLLNLVAETRFSRLVCHSTYCDDILLFVIREAFY